MKNRLLILEKFNLNIIELIKNGFFDKHQLTAQ